MRYIALDVIKSELSSDSAKRGIRISYCCNSAPLMGVGHSSNNGSGDGTNERLVATAMAHVIHSLGSETNSARIRIIL